MAIREGRFATTITGEVDLHSTAFLLQDIKILMEQSRKESVVFKEIAESQNAVTPSQRNSLSRKVNDLKRVGWLSQRILTVEERRRMGIKRGGRMGIFTFSTKSNNYLKEYGSFTNPNGRLRRDFSKPRNFE